MYDQVHNHDARTKNSTEAANFYTNQTSYVKNVCKIVHC